MEEIVSIHSIVHKKKKNIVKNKNPPVAQVSPKVIKKIKSNSMNKSIIKGKISRSKLQKQLSFYLNLIIFELESNIIDENTFKTILLNNKGEKLSKIVEKKYGKYIPEPKIKLKYTYKSPPVYINESKTDEIIIEK